jgi:hypothetical protein
LWLGHESVAVTLEHYVNWIKETDRLAEEVNFKHPLNDRKCGELFLSTRIGPVSQIGSCMDPLATRMASADQAPEHAPDRYTR